MATSGQFYWPSVGSSVAAYGQFPMAANTQARPGRGLVQAIDEANRLVYILDDRYVAILQARYQY